MTRESPEDDDGEDPTGDEAGGDSLGDEATRDSNASESPRRSSGSENADGPPEPSEMTLDELREEIQSIDRDLVDLIARRTYVADTIAQVKDAEGLPTVDEHQEARVMNRAGENAERFDVDANLVKAIFRLLIELNKVHQRENR